ncbi:hemerythrin domain-containing protein [Thaumasiovibrio sp. DFM-14]|uniref:hemerythrin domain-containing protein n=1 Tax=Thaumasiovibrio sp. DFM-14 TaxID=3384792 RepID=UPI00399EF48E
MLESIHREHIQINRLLRLLREKLRIIETGEREVEYPLIKVVVDYLQTRAEKCHHPKEDIIYRHLKQHFPELARDVEDLEREHQELAVLTEAFQDTLTMILMDAVIPLDMLKQSLTEFVDRQQAHLEFEEREILPFVRKHFTEKDWEVVNSQWEDESPDPLFGERVEQRYKVLAKRLAM